MAQCLSFRDVWLPEKNAKDVDAPNLKGYAGTMADCVPTETGREWHGVIHKICHGNVKSVVSTREFSMIRWKVFNFNSARSMIIPKLSTKSSHNTEFCQYKIDTVSDYNLMAINMFKLHLSKTRLK